MKRVLSLFLSCIFVLGVCFSTPIVASATGENTFTVENNVFQYNEGSNECSLKKWGNSSVDALTLPDIAEYNANTYTITGVLSDAFSECKNLKTLTIKSNIKTIEAGAFAGCEALTAFVESSESLNTNFEVVDGVLFNQNQTTLIAYPAAKEGAKYTIPSDVTEIANGAFSGADVYLFSEKSDGSNISGSENLKIHYAYNSEIGYKHNYVDAVCTVCELECKHVEWEDGECTECGLVCEHTGGTCDEEGLCEICKTTYTASHKWTFTKLNDENAIKATCGNVNCDYAGENALTITLEAPTEELVYDGAAKVAIVTDDAEENIFENTKITYELKSVNENDEVIYTALDGESLPTNTGAYRASITLGEGENAKSVLVEFTIKKATPTFTAPEARGNLTYTGAEQELVNAGIINELQGEIQYKLDNGDWSTAVPTGTNAGTYTVYYKVVGNENYNDVEECSVDVTIAPKTITVTLIQGSGVYNGSAHEPDVDLNDLCENETLAINTDYTVNYANNTNVGTATVTVELMDTLIAKNYTFANNAKTATLNYTIAKGIASINETPIANDLTYTGTEQELVKAGTATGGTMMYSLTGEDDWVSDIPKEKDAGKYTVYYKVVGDANHYDSEVGSIEVEIKKAILTVKSIECSEKTYDGTTDVTVSGIVFDGIKSSDALAYDEEKVKAVADNPAASEAVKVTVSGIELTGDSAKNYEVVSTAETTISIKARSVKITSEDASIIVNAEFPSFVFKADNGLLSGHTLNGGKGVVTEANSSTVIENTATAGEYSVTPSEVKIYAGEADVTANYEITYEAGKLIIKDCTAHEWKDGECTNCHTKCEHKDKSNTIDKQPTCVETGVLLTKCKVCDFVEESTLDINPDAHKMSDWKETVKATCSSTGTEESVCENGCGHKETRSTEKDPDNHTYGDWVVTEATCVADGEKVKTCTNTECKHELKETIAKDPTAHKMATEWEVTKEPTCVETGLQVKICLNAGCDHEVEEVIAIKADAHNLGGWVVTKAAKCTIAGEITRFCKNGSCEYKVTDSLDPDGETHTFAEDFTIIEATCITAGSKFKACENEGCKEVAEKTEIAINPDAHKNVETINVKEATCEEKGYTGDEHCNDCKKTFEPGIEVDALGHTESDWIVDKEATFTEEGARHTACTVCKKELKKEVIAKLTLDTPSPKAYNKTGCIKVKWADVDNALTYNVYRSEYVNKKWTTWKRIASNVKQGVGYYNDKNVSEGKQYKYTVKAYNGDFVSGKKASNKLIFISPVKPSLTTTTTGIILKWNTVLGADKYIAYRSKIVDGKWSDWKKVVTITDGKSSWVDTTAESGVTYKYSVRVYKGSSYSNRDASDSIIFLTQPSLKLSNTSTGIKGSWKTVNGATGYVITRAEYNDSIKKYGPAVKIGTASGTAKSFTDKTAKAGVKYKYTITAINGSYSSIVSPAKSYRRLAQPTVTIENTNGAIKGTWTQVTGAASYIIYRSEVVNGKWSSWKNLGTAGATAKSFTDKTVKSGVKYKYRVIAKNGGSKSSAEASNKLVYLACPKATVSNSIYGAKVKWNVITGAESYIVYRKSYVNKQWTAWQQIAKTSTNSYTDSTAVSGAKYRYTIHAVNDGSLSARKDSASFVYVEAPKTTTTVTAKAITLNWNEIGGAKKYVVYRAELGADGKWLGWTKVASLKGVNTFADTTVVAGKTYKYKVNACIGKSKSSSNSTDGVLVPKAQ